MFLPLEGQTKEEKDREGLSSWETQQEAVKCSVFACRSRRGCGRSSVILILALSLAFITNSGKVTQPNGPNFLPSMGTAFPLALQGTLKTGMQNK